MQPAHSNPALPEVCKPAPSAVKWEWQPDAEFLWFLPHRRNSPGCFSLAAAAIFSGNSLSTLVTALSTTKGPLPAPEGRGSGLPLENRFRRHNRALAQLSVSPVSGNWPDTVFRLWRFRTTRRHGRFYRSRSLASLCRP